jgi:hypothetical protein
MKNNFIEVYTVGKAKKHDSMKTIEKDNNKTWQRKEGYNNLMNEARVIDKKCYLYI